MQAQQIQVVGTRIALQGERAIFTAERHKVKLDKCPLDCGVDIYPLRIRIMADAAPSPEDPAYDVLAVNDHRNIIYVMTGLHWTTGPNTFSLLTERSSSPEKLNGGRVVQGIIDANYTGELIVRVEAATQELDDVIGGLEACIEENLAIAQIIPMGFFYAGFEMVTAGNIIVPLGGRGANGFGSTDQKG